MKRPIIITTPYPTSEEVAGELGISAERMSRLRALVAHKQVTAVNRASKKTGKSPGKRKPSVAGSDQNV